MERVNCKGMRRAHLHPLYCSWVYAIACICATVAPQAFRHGAGKIVVKIVLVAVRFGVHAIGPLPQPGGVLPLTLPRLLERVLKIVLVIIFLRVHAKPRSLSLAGGPPFPG